MLVGLQLVVTGHTGPTVASTAHRSHGARGEYKQCTMGKYGDQADTLGAEITLLGSFMMARLIELCISHIHVNIRMVSAWV